MCLSVSVCVCAPHTRLSLCRPLFLPTRPCSHAPPAHPAALPPEHPSPPSPPTHTRTRAQVWSAHTDCSASELRRAISATAIDKGAPGRDENFGFGVIQSLAAHEYLKANPCSGKNVQFNKIVAQNQQQQMIHEEAGRVSQDTQRGGGGSGPLGAAFDITIPAAVSAPVGERVALPYVLSPRTPCPAGGEPVIATVTIGRRLRRCLPALEYVSLREARTVSVRETCNPAQSRGQYSFVAARSRAQAGDCYELEVTTVDNQVHHSIMMFTE